MRIGMFLLAAGWPGRDHGATLRAAVDAAVAAEEAGFDDVWVAEHHFTTYGLCPSAVTLAGYLLGATRRITVGTAVSVLPTAHPVALAEQALLLDQVSGGRFRLGLGRGGPWVDLEVFGTGADRWSDGGYTEALDALLSTLDGPTVSADGPHFRFRPVPVTPAPRPGAPRGGVAPILAATSGSGISAAAGRGLPMLLGMHADDAEKARFVEQYDELVADPGRHRGPSSGRAGHGGPPLDRAGADLRPARAGADLRPAAREVGRSVRSGGVHPDSGRVGADRPSTARRGDRGEDRGQVVPRHVSAGIAHVEDSTARARAVVREALPRWLEPGLAGYVRFDGAPRTPRDAHEYTDLLCDLHPVGDANHAVARLVASAEATGVDHVVLLTDCTGDPARTRENVARLGADVLPRLPGRTAAGLGHAADP
ncbi:LLM class flavin-dependent oxidoreductase [Pseudonocardia endophytica]|uniref:Alkanesulfonate monooxygenase SsuD/methylene tetrahydromethanopterin reductase-like flavin-dependent oxidoreductase (Luciferase family) n=1 Tax=Pseudonocardia endophytica TaxID=401976 RepID=A0A4R1HKM0_PSEEN|nr:LLM class flavin-dependent oxidoreductase [Pseudonocardia endophytica]TCK22954.1 alkanesulfonate monooxygenase SsuD/methylene tetrahydromethanopterin reductase-like flavin-dependent oxidoreductase (luciferase family) [Pseudonocardia endophytica]